MNKPFTTPKVSYKEMCSEMTSVQKKVWRNLFNSLARRLYKNIRELRNDISLDDCLSTVQLLWECGLIKLAYNNNPFILYWYKWDYETKKYKVWFQFERKDKGYEI